jgi:hypothetical protein
MVIDDNVIGIIIIIIFLFYNYKHKISEYFTSSFVVSEYDKRYYKVDVQFSDKNIAANKLAILNEFIIQYLKYIKKNIINSNTEPRNKKLFFKRILNNYNLDNIFENNPLPGGETSFVSDKGLEFGICLRQKINQSNEFHKINILKFVMLHELTHLGCVLYGHEHEFWEWFKVVLSEAVKSRLYIPIDYSKNPENYCGLNVTTNPYCVNNKC